MCGRVAFGYLEIQNVLFLRDPVTDVTLNIVQLKSRIKSGKYEPNQLIYDQFADPKDP